MDGLIANEKTASGRADQPQKQADSRGLSGAVWAEKAEDFAFFSDKVPGFYFSLGGKPVDVPLSETADHHTPDFYVDEAGMPLGVKAMVAVTLAYMDANPEAGEILPQTGNSWNFGEMSKC